MTTRLRLAIRMISANWSSRFSKVLNENLVMLLLFKTIFHQVAIRSDFIIFKWFVANSFISHFLKTNRATIWPWRKEIWSFCNKKVLNHMQLVGAMVRTIEQAKKATFQPNVCISCPQWTNLQLKYWLVKDFKLNIIYKIKENLIIFQFYSFSAIVCLAVDRKGSWNNKRQSNSTITNNRRQGTHSRTILLRSFPVNFFSLIISEFKILLFIKNFYSHYFYKIHSNEFSVIAKGYYKLFYLIVYEAKKSLDLSV